MRNKIADTVFWLAGLIAFVWERTVRFVVCHVTRIHAWEIKVERFERSVLIGDGRRRMDRGWIRVREHRCWRCGSKKIDKKRRSIASDWQDPARLFEG